MVVAATRALKAKPPDHPFYCAKKGLRKTAWDTPEYLSQRDWELAREVAAVKSGEALAALVYSTPERTDAYFNRIVGWPEGRTYMRSADFVNDTAWPGFQRHQRPQLLAAIAARNGK